MRRIILSYGAVAGGVIIGSTILSLNLAEGEIGASLPEWLGYLVMIVVLSVIFIGIKRYRDRDLGGVIRFKTAATLGLGITLVASVVYVTAWEVHLAMTDHAFIEEYTQSVLATKQAEGLAGAALEAEVANMERLEARYADPVFRLPMTFLEIFPVGLLITLAAAGLLRNSNFLPDRDSGAAPQVQYFTPGESGRLG